MSQQLSFILLLPLILWSTFQGILYMHASQVEETLLLAAFEGQKEASLQGYYDENIVKKIEDFLVEGYGIKRDVIKVESSTLTDERWNGTKYPRGERIDISISIPSPVVHVMDLFRFTEPEDLVVHRTIMSEAIFNE